MLAGEAAARGVLAKPSHLELLVPPGRSVAARLTLSGTTAERTRVRIHVEDFDLDIEGRPIRGAATASRPTSAGAFLVDPEELVLEGGEAQTVFVDVQAPEGSLPSRWALLVLDVEEEENGGAAPLAATRLLVPVVANVDGSPAPDLKILSFETARSGASGCVAHLVVENGGDVAVRPRLALGLAPASRRESDELALTERGSFLLLPGHRRILQGPVDCGAATSNVEVVGTIELDTTRLLGTAALPAAVRGAP